MEEPGLDPIRKPLDPIRKRQIDDELQRLGIGNKQARGNVSFQGYWSSGVL